MNFELERRRMMMAQKASDGPPYHGYLIHGNPTIDGNLYYPTNENYIYTPVPFDPEDLSWEFVTKIDIPYTLGGNGDLFCTVDGDGEQALGYACRMLKITSTAMGVRIYASSNGQTNDLGNPWNPGGAGSSRNAKNPTYRATRNGTTYGIRKNTQSAYTTTWATPPLFGNHIAIGGGGGTVGVAFTIDLSSTYINLNGKLWWSAI